MVAQKSRAVYLARALHEAGVDVRVYHSDATAEKLVSQLDENHIPRISYNRVPTLPLRLAYLGVQLAQFRPHIVHAGRSYTGLYAGVLGRPLRALAIGAIRNSLAYEKQALGRLAKFMLQVTDAQVANSTNAYKELRADPLVKPERVFLLDNVLDVAAFDEAANKPVSDEIPRGIMFVVGSCQRNARNICWMLFASPCKRDQICT